MSKKKKVSLTLPAELLDKVRLLVSPRGMSRFVSEAVDKHIKEIKREKLKNELIEGYQVSGKRDIDVLNEWEVGESQ